MSLDCFDDVCPVPAICQFLIVAPVLVGSGRNRQRVSPCGVHRYDIAPQRSNCTEPFFVHRSHSQNMMLSSLGRPPQFESSSLSRIWADSTPGPDIDCDFESGIVFNVSPFSFPQPSL